MIHLYLDKNDDEESLVSEFSLSRSKKASVYELWFGEREGQLQLPKGREGEGVSGGRQCPRDFSFLSVGEYIAQSFYRQFIGPRGVVVTGDGGSKLIAALN
ncbi:unnamed protein product [Dovyalis caffra]|uniref:Uncharacterized protein n=1 Tax=Dovyalis caffra TaxID=77055 RepID=A0AAV1R4V8_9ROSI|nr:unnamed protein product [Dovyalis caffra]